MEALALTVISNVQHLNQGTCVTSPVTNEDIAFTTSKIVIPMRRAGQQRHPSAATRDFDGREGSRFQARMTGYSQGSWKTSLNAIIGQGPIPSSYNPLRTPREVVLVAWLSRHFVQFAWTACLFIASQPATPPCATIHNEMDNKMSDWMGPLALGKTVSRSRSELQLRVVQEHRTNNVRCSLERSGSRQAILHMLDVERSYAKGYTLSL
ncbi:hypothetical protein C8J56DRAFT_1030726 [Mycena floridula]|nr:hypothetical protein C8J56DRAFT_1030726 [Mycena floridula]